MCYTACICKGERVQYLGHTVLWCFDRVVLYIRGADYTMDGTRSSPVMHIVGRGQVLFAFVALLRILII